MSAAASFKITQATPESRIAAVVGSIVVVGLAAAPLWLDRNVISIAGQMLVYVGLASLWNLLAGYGGLVSVGQQAYVGMGAYLLFAGGILFGVPPLLAVPLAGTPRGFSRCRFRCWCSGCAAPILRSAPGSSPKCFASSRRR